MSKILLATAVSVTPSPVIVAYPVRVVAARHTARPCTVVAAPVKKRGA